jgi:hypothetical protein
MTFRHAADGSVLGVCVNGKTRLRRRRGESVESLEVRALDAARRVGLGGGRGDSEEADLVRDQMDGPGRDLSPEENRASSHFSVKLDILWAKRDPEGYRRSCTGNHGLAELLQSLWSDHQYLVE